MHRSSHKVAGTLLGALGLVLLVAWPSVTHAGPKESGVNKVVRTGLPYWQVGNINKSLSRMCSLGYFNQRVPYLISGHFSGVKGSAMVGAAKGSGYNLWDPQKIADDRFDYWFFRDRTNSCIVFTSCVTKENGQCTVTTPADQQAIGRKPKGAAGQQQASAAPPAQAAAR